MSPPNPVVMIATPSLYGRLSVDYVMSLQKTQALLQQHGIDVDLAIISGSPYLAEVRNVLASAALHRPNVTDLFFIDDDVGWPPHKVLEFLQRPQDVVAGAYPKRDDQGGWPCTLEQGPVVQDGLYRATLVPAGFLRIKRGVLETLAKTAVRYTAQDMPLWAFFETRTVDLQMEAVRSTDLDALSQEEAVRLLRQSLGLSFDAHAAQYWGEDYWFTVRWRELGGECWIDPDIMFTHTGSKQYSGRLADALKEKT